MDVFVIETRGEKKPIYWLLERTISENSEESKAFVHIYACYDRMWAQRQIKDTPVRVFNPSKDLFGIAGSTMVDHQYWLSIYIDGDNNCYYLRSTQSHLLNGEQEPEVIESDLALHSTDLFKHLPELVRQAADMAMSRNVLLSLDRPDEQNH